MLWHAAACRSALPELGEAKGVWTWELRPLSGHCSLFWVAGLRVGDSQRCVPVVSTHSGHFRPFYAILANCQALLTLAAGTVWPGTAVLLLGWALQKCRSHQKGGTRCGDRTLEVTVGMNIRPIVDFGAAGLRGTQRSPTP